MKWLLLPLMLVFCYSLHAQGGSSQLSVQRIISIKKLLPQTINILDTGVYKFIANEIKLNHANFLEVKFGDVLANILKAQKTIRESNDLLVYSYGPKIYSNDDFQMALNLHYSTTRDFLNIITSYNSARPNEIPDYTELVRATKVIL